MTVMNAHQQTQALLLTLDRRGVILPYSAVKTLRRAQMTLHRWAELECGDGNDYASWAIERETVYVTGDGRTFYALESAKVHAAKVFDASGNIIAIEEREGRPLMVRYPHQGKSSRSPIPDRERGALKRVAALCSEYGLSYYHQTDPRGCALYISAEPITDCDYTNGVAV